jgi:hypothetical protein
MVKAHITTKDGTTINLDGTADEVAALVAKFGLMSKTAATADAAPQPAAAKPATVKAKAKSGGKSRKAGVQAIVTEMVGDGYFKQPKLLGAVRTELEQGAHFYTRPAVGKALERAMRSKQLRRIKQGGKWAYVG